MDAGLGARAPRGRDDPDRLLGLGEAAELLGLSHMELRDALGEGKLETLPGRRGERLMRLVRVGDLARFWPAALEAVLPLPVPGTELVPATPPVDPAPVAHPPPPPRSRPLTGDSPDPSAYLWNQLDHLRGEVRAGEQENRRLLGELARSGGEVRDLLEKIALAEARRAELEARLARERSQVEGALNAVRRTRRLGAAGVLAAVAGGALIWFGGYGGSGSVRAGESPPAETRHSPTLVPPLGEGPRPVPLPDDGGFAAETSIAPAVVTPVSSVSSEDPGTAREAGAPGSGDPTEEAQGDGTLAEPERAGEAPGALPGDRPCAQAVRTRRGGGWRSILGPCRGRWNQDLRAVVGTHRVGGVSTCGHHHFFQRVLGGSLERARDMAAFARREGLVPPLVKLRVNRAGADFLQRRVPSAWIDSGFEAGVDGGHDLLARPGIDAWSLRSWVRYRDPQGVEQRRSFRMQLTLDEGPQGDRLTLFQWTDG